ncbi:MAG: hypothetical protein JXO48_09155 [Deltaproteobacteria bacterium]|nr:hypothetical protein [Deltaproteobacteria bacterium]
MKPKLVLGTVAAVIIVCFLSYAYAGVWKHRDVRLKNEHGEIITPERNDGDPYSPRRTCGGCHPYSTITSGFHFQQGFDEMSDSYNPRQPWILSPGMFGKW